MNYPDFSTAAERNKQPILEVLQRVLPTMGHALEIASGTGQHASWFAAGLSQWTWQPTEARANALDIINRRVAEQGLTNVLPVVLLDVMADTWLADDPAIGTPRFDAIYCANMLHIAPWPTCGALMAGAARHLRSGSGVLITYGPYFEDEAQHGPTAPSNLAFDEDLRARNPAWGIRRIEDVVAEARRVGLALRERHAMPANNLLLVFGFN